MCAELRGWRGNASVNVLKWRLPLVACGLLSAALLAEPVNIPAGTPTTLDLSSTNTLDLQLTMTPGRWALEVEQRLAELQLSLRDPQSDATQTLAASDSDLIVWMGDSDNNHSLDVQLTLRSRSATAPTAVVRWFRLDPAQGAVSQALQAEARISLLAIQPSDSDEQQSLTAALDASGFWNEAGQPLRAARATLTAASLARKLGRLDEALQWSLLAADAFGEDSQDYLHGSALNNAGLVSIQRRDATAARHYLERARDLMAERYAGVAVNPADSNLCFIDLRTGRLERAEQCYLRLLEQAQASGDLSGVRRYQNNLGGIYSERGEPLRAIEYLQAALETATALGDTFNQARALNGLAVQYSMTGRFQDALNYHQRSLDGYRRIGDRAQIARALSNIGIAYGKLGVYQQSIAFLREAHDMRQSANDEIAMMAKNNLAGALSMTGRFDEAFRLYEEALAIAERLRSPANLGAIQLDLGVARMAAGDSEAGMQLLEQALTALDADDRVRRSKALHHLGLALTRNGDPQQAADALRKAATLREQTGDGLGLTATISAQGWLHWRRGDIDAALADARQAIERIETLRIDIANPDLRASYKSALADAYELAIYCLMHGKQPDSAGALAMAERYRAQTLVDVLTRNAVTEIADVPQPLLDRRLALRARINRAEDARLRGRSAEDVSEIIAQLNVLDDEIADRDPRFRAVSRRDVLRVENFADLLDPQTAVLQFFLGREGSFVWLIDHTEVRVFRLPSAAGIDQLARELHATLARRGDHRPLALALGNALLAPLADTLAEYSNVAIVADGALHYIPFDVLRVSGSSAAQFSDQTLSYLPSLTTLALVRDNHRQPSDQRGIVVFADPVFSVNDPRLGANTMTTATTRRGADARSLNRLAMSGEEARAIQRLAGERALRIRTGTEASASALSSPAVRHAQIIHIASHGFVNDDLPARTGLALSMHDASGEPLTGFVGLRDIYELRLSAELVVLSACDTALGRDLAGEGLLGLTRGFMYAGADRVVASLWQVEDRATATLMEAFYRHLLVEKRTPAAALAAAKRELQASQRWRHPYYWSGFVLLGDWQALR